RLPRNPGQRRLTLPVRDRAAALARDIEPDRAAEAELPRHRCDAVDADAPRGLIEIDVAGFLDPVMQAHRTVAFFAPAMEGRIPEREIARAADRCVGRHRARFERRQGYDRLECRSRRIDA